MAQQLIEYRPYQSEAITSVYDYFDTHPVGNPVVAMPTGTGKSVVIGGFVHSVLSRWPRQRIIKLTHVKELIEQNFDKLLRLWPTAPAGIYSAGLGRRDILPITYAGIASVYKLAEAFGHVDLVLIDECHLVGNREEAMYQIFFNALLAINPRLRFIGFTATPWRLGMGRITEGGLFTHFCCDMTGRAAFNRFIEEAYLSPLVPKRTHAQLDVQGVRIQGGEFNQADLQSAVDKDIVTYKALYETCTHANDRRKWLFFTTGIEHTENVAEMLVTHFGISALPVHSKISNEERASALAKFQRGQVRCLVNSNILTTGFDDPEIDLIGVLRPTNSPVLWVQMLGRGTRPVYAQGYESYLNTLEGRRAAIAAGPKANCLVMDFASNTARLGPINDPVIPKKRGASKGQGSAPVKICPSCNAYNHTSVRYCEHCGAEFAEVVNFGTHASQQELIAGSDLPQMEVFPVQSVTYDVHQPKQREGEPAKPPSLKVSYFCGGSGLRLFKEYVCFEHSGFSRAKAHKWWKQRTQAGSWIPETVAQSKDYVQQLPVPKSIRVWVNKKHPEVMAYDFTGTGFDG